MFQIFSNPTYTSFIKEALMFRNFLDIFIIASLVYSLILLFKKTKSTPIIVGILLLVGVYGISVIFKLPITQTLFQSLFGMFLVILAIIFQKELRKFFEIIGVLGIKRKTLPPQEQALKAVLSSVKLFSEKKIGALIVFPGRESLERHLDGGVVLNGKVSEALLVSLFDDSTPGHDGAVIINGDKISKFAAHLPLAENIEQVKKFGTRHRAALGLSEVSDSLCLVVSEERGTISIAYQKNLTPFKNIEEAEQVLSKFIEEKYPHNKVETYKKSLKENYLSMISALGIAFFIWMIFTSQTSMIQRKFIVPIEFKNIPQNYVVASASSQEIEVLISGRDSDFSLLNPKDLKATIDMAGVKPGWHRILVNESDIIHPLIVSVVQVDPTNIQINLKKQ